MPKITVGTATEQDYTQLIALLDDVFFRDEEEPRRDFLTLLPKLYKREYKPWDHNYCVWEDGVLQAAVGMYVYDMRVGGLPLRVGGIGNVAVARESRRKGYMKLAMDAAMEAMRAAGCDFGELGGQRQRYQYWGFERGGAAVHASFSETNLRHAYGNNALAPAWRAQRILPGDANTIAQVLALAEAEPLHYIHDPAQFYDCLCSWAGTPYAIWHGDALAGFFSLAREEDSVSQFLLRDAGDLEMALRAAYTALPANPRNNKNISLRIPLWQAELVRLAEKISENGNTLEDTGSFVILNWHTTLQAFMQLQAQSKPLPDGEITLRIEGYAGTETLRICVTDGTPAAEPYAGQPQHTFTHLEAMRYVLSPHSALRQGDALAQSWFPLPLQLMGIDTV